MSSSTCDQIAESMVISWIKWIQKIKTMRAHTYLQKNARKDLEEHKFTSNLSTCTICFSLWTLLVIVMGKNISNLYEHCGFKILVSEIRDILHQSALKLFLVVIELIARMAKSKLSLHANYMSIKARIVQTQHDQFHLFIADLWHLHIW